MLCSNKFVYNNIILCIFYNSYVVFKVTQYVYVSFIELKGNQYNVYLYVYNTFWNVNCIQVNSDMFNCISVNGKTCFKKSTTQLANNTNDKILITDKL